MGGRNFVRGRVLRTCSQSSVANCGLGYEAVACTEPMNDRYGSAAGSGERPLPGRLYVDVAA